MANKSQCLRQLRGMVMREVNRPAFRYVVRQWKPARYGDEDDLKERAKAIFIRERMERWLKGENCLLDKGVENACKQS